MKEALNTERLVLLLAAGALALFLIGAELWPTGSAPRTAIRGIGVGKTVDVNITLVTADSHDLACAGSLEVKGARCAFDKDGAAWRNASTGGEVLAPYMTSNNVLLLIPNLFAEPSIAKRLAEEPPQGVQRDSLRRFIASCKLQVDEKVKDFFVRWTPTAQWSHRADAWAGRISGCTVKDR